MNRVFALVVAAGVLVACGTDARGVDACRRVEGVRCQRATSCGVDLKFIKYPGSSEADAVDGCVRYYREACLHGLVAEEPGATRIQECTDAVQNGSCDIVRAPETAPACSWLVPAAPPAPDAAAPAPEPADAATD